MKVQIEFGILQNLCKYCTYSGENCLHPHNLKRLNGSSCGECNEDDCPFCTVEVDKEECL